MPQDVNDSESFRKQHK